jgi:ureidoglycolate hydrolase
MVLALSFAPCEKVMEYLIKLETYLLKEEKSKILDIYRWFKLEYLSSDKGNKTRDFWNVYQRTKDNIPRTPNSLEGFHRHPNTFITTKQSSFIVILSELKNEQTAIENKPFFSLYNEKKRRIGVQRVFEKNKF